ncbi:NAD(P)-dependent dehydrogenase [Yamadazyma tenuis]|uniref:NAD(P)-binding protein n=1 Tax=Candida tenuis (strain ATCC 10573 / BCRC 21748 / CBS 615 / JCM 9827 / NBRC 10315 / NRRL Y-1498 / VKM Y-70) TaxID=590646 RepID=G3B0Y3_CANTC|nr:NAD(P)-binding protein [Yamadazyma tenuis ATCC 10573]XP_006685947.1 uncharacterized protein CANTEDRAFT_113598 [Yamadazyma tenuis ATCC 10573]EGV65140.1 NAD(P)-binding protein [Yamadazyma tenuis ATCC 10573]EGV65141.1 hypothetical protein CANTEDRAFT_113598 [Yamadazyma tenuis ATCC 10573]WEJ97629.1 NAD(P)-dependent dehydrogenase [Yamadazyma tenuis]
MSSQTTYFITGTNRGIGLAYVEHLTSDKSNLVIATVRSEKAAGPLTALNRDNLKIIYLDMADSSAKFEAAFKQLEHLAPNGIDVFIQNAGISGPKFLVPAEQYNAESYAEVLTINVGGSAKAYNALYPYLFKGTGTKKIVFLSTIAAQIGFPAGGNAYSASKAAVNHLAVQIAKQNAGAENELVRNSATVMLHPGLVETDMAEEPKAVWGSAGFISPSESVEKSLKVVAGLTAADTGKFLSYEGDELPFVV